MKQMLVADELSCRRRGVDPSKPRVVVLGASGHARVVSDAVRLAGDYEIVGFLDDMYPERHDAEFCGSTILGGREQLDELREHGVRHAVVGIGDCAARLRLAEAVSEKGFTLATAIHPRAIVADDVTVGGGTVVCAGAVVNPGSRIGANVIVNTSASVDHECIVEDGAHIGPGAHLGGRVHVKRAAWVGIGAAVKDGVTIGAGSIVGAGAVVLRDIPDGVVAYGIPATVRKAVSDHAC